MGWLKIEQVAQETGLTKRTIRYYEEIGLLDSPHRSEKGTRLYTPEDIENLRRVVDAKEVLGISLQDLQRFVSFRHSLEAYRRDYKGREAPEVRKERTEKLSELRELLDEQLELLDRKLEKMTAFRDELHGIRVRATEVLDELESTKE
ncbi:MerR family transcriptional regulator [Paenibacillus glufosinatiresistens]|uniref:MerR family transcriptional regulator n=1 Tax=Paenibacillus glufosinatiresistens TaxID=3070657 RepID=UPI00286E9D74|nr:MerR family transcriptional regulator [Paenibacillus sp. YX.27]